MPGKISRRKLLHKSGSAVLAGGVGLCAARVLGARELSAPPSPAKGVDYYQKLGVTPFINAAGTYTVLSGSTMPEEVQAAIALASLEAVNILELRDAAGAYLAKRLKCEAALVTSGAAAGLTLGTAACLTRGNKDAILNIPADLESVELHAHGF